MAWIQTVQPKQAKGLLKRLYDEAIQRAGKVFQVVRLQSLRPTALQASMRLYTTLMHRSDHGLSRAQREMLATVVSQINGCHY